MSGIWGFLCKNFSTNLNGSHYPWNEHLVKKIRSTRSQKKLNAIQRRQNLKNAYQVTEKIPGFSVLVVDDVYTTGSTADAMAMCLLEAGAEKVYFLTICAGRA